jgi:hypothetical protein
LRSWPGALNCFGDEDVIGNETKTNTIANRKAQIKLKWKWKRKSLAEAQMRAQKPANAHS